MGSAALAACLAKNHIVTAFVRNPAKLPLEVIHHPRLRIFKGDATCQYSLAEAIRDQDAIVQAAVYGNPSTFGRSDSEKVVRCIITAIKEVQSAKRYRGPSIRLWVLSGQVLLDVPGGAKGRIEADIIPIHPEHYHNYAFLQQDACNLNWSRLCPRESEKGDVRVFLYECKASTVH